MKFKNFLLLFIILILLSNFASADLNQDLVSVWKLDSNASDELGNFSGTNVGVDFSTAGKDGNAGDFKASESDRFYVNDLTFLEDSGSFTFSTWIKPETLPANGHIFSWGGSVLIQTRTENSNIAFMIYDTGLSANKVASTTNPLSTGNWFHLVGRYDSGVGLEIFVNNVSVGTLAWTGSFYTSRANNNNFGSQENNGNYFDGLIDEFMIWDRALTNGEISDLYNENFYPFVSTSTNNFSVSAVSNWSGDSISNFSVEINNNGTIYSTTTGTLTTDILQNSTSLYNITFFDSDWFNRSYLNVNVSSDLVASLFATDIVFNFRFQNGDLIPTLINLSSLNTSNSFVVSGGVQELFPDANNQVFHVQCNNNVFAPFNVSFDFVSLQNESFNLTVNETPTYLYFYDSISGDPISGANVNVLFPSGYSDVFVTNSSGAINFSYIQNDIVEFGNYSFSFSKLGYSVLNFSEVINASFIPFNESYNISRASLTINIYNRSTGIVLSGVNVSVNFVGLFNETTNNGSIFKENLSIIGGEYSIFVSAPGFRTEKRVFSFSNQEELEIDFYLLSLTDSNIGILTATTSDNYFRKVSGVPVSLLEYNEDSLSFISVSQCVSNVDGECDFVVELNTKLYYLRASTIIDGVVYVADTDSNGEIFTSSGIIRNLIFQVKSQFNVDGSNNLIYSVSESFVNNVSSISVDFINSDGTNVEVCVEYFKKEAGSYVSVTNDLYCLVSSDAIQNINTNVLLNRSNSYKAEVYIKRDGGDIPLKNYFYASVNDADNVFDVDFKSVLILILWIVALGFSLHSKNITLWFILAISLSWVNLVFFPSFVLVVLSVFKTIISFLTLMVARKTRDFN